MTGRVVGKYYPGRWRNVSSRGSDVTSSPMKMGRSLARLGFTLKAMGNTRVFEQDGNMMSSIVWKINPTAAMGDGEVRKPTVFGDDLGEIWNKGSGNGGEKRDTIPLSSGRVGGK